MAVHFYGQHRPDSVSIMGTDYKVEWFQDMEPLGEIDFHQCHIRLSKKLTPTMAVDTLIHEILHGLWYFAALGRKVKEEQAVSVIASGLNSVFASNEGLANWIKEIHEG